jgi:hypothetical protein
MARQELTRIEGSHAVFISQPPAVADLVHTAVEAPYTPRFRPGRRRRPAE